MLATLKERLLKAIKCQINADVTQILSEARDAGLLQKPLLAAVGETPPLHVAAAATAADGDSSIVRMLLSSGASVNATCSGGFTALFLAAVAGNAAVVELLLQHAHADANHPGPAMVAPACGFTPLMMAARNQHVQVVKQLLAAGADAAEALWQCAGFPPSTGHSDFLPAVDTLLAAGVKADVRFSVAPSIDQNPLHAAAASDHASVAHALLAAGAAVDATDNDGRTALHHAAMYGSSTVAGVLLQAGAAVDVYGSDGFLPLHLAVALKKTAIAELLCQHMSAQQINLLSLQGNHSALFTAVVTQNADVVSALLGAGADPVAPSTSSGADLAAFRAAACMPSVEVVNCFLQHAAADQLTAAVIVNAASLAACHIRSATQPDKQQQVMIRLLQAAVDKDPDVLAANMQSAVAPTFAAAMITCLLSLLKQADASMCAREAAVSANLADVAAQRTAVQQLLVGVAAAQKWPAGGTGAAGGSRWSGCRWQLGALQAAALFALGAGCCAALQCLRARSK